MNWEELQAGRRRNWEKLKDPEIRRKERLEKAAAEREQRRKAEEEARAKHELAAQFGMAEDSNNPELRKSYFQRREEALAESARRSLADFQRVRKQAVLIVGAVAVLFLLSWAWNQVTFRREGDRRLAEFTRLNGMISEGVPVAEYGSPLAALASWRSALARGDAAAYWNSFSSRRQRDLTEQRDAAVIIAEYQRLFETGSMDAEVGVARAFERPEIVHIPATPSDGSLAIFRALSRELSSEGSTERPVIEYALAVSWDERRARWGYADSRPAPMFSVKWTHESMIRPAKGGAQAVFYDEQGNEVPRSEITP